jgi:hypothetical protein
MNQVHIPHTPFSTHEHPEWVQVDSCKAGNSSHESSGNQSSPSSVYVVGYSAKKVADSPNVLFISGNGAATMLLLVTFDCSIAIIEISSVVALVGWVSMEFGEDRREDNVPADGMADIASSAGA